MVTSKNATKTLQDMLRYSYRENRREVRHMTQISMMAEWNRLERLSEIGDPLERINGVIDWEIFRPT